MHSRDLRNALDLPQGESAMKRFTHLLFVRQVEQFIADKYSEQVFRCPVHLSIGQEAVAVGVCSALEAEDHVVSTHRSHAHYLARGGDLLAMFGELLGKPSGCCQGRGGSMHLFDKSVNFDGSIPIVGSSIAIATGIGLALKQKKKGIVVSFQGDASYESGQFFEALNFAATFAVPILIVIEDNGYSTYSPRKDRQPDSFSLGDVVKGYGVGFWDASGDDVETVYSVTQDVVDHVRKHRPGVIRFSTFRSLEHCGPNRDDDLGYRSAEEIASYLARDPLAVGARNLTQSPESSLALAKLQRKIDNYIAEKFDEISRMPDTRADDLNMFIED